MERVQPCPCSLGTLVVSVVYSSGMRDIHEAYLSRTPPHHPNTPTPPGVCPSCRWLPGVMVDLAEKNGGPYFTKGQSIMFTIVTLYGLVMPYQLIWPQHLGETSQSSLVEEMACRL